MKYTLWLLYKIRIYIDSVLTVTLHGRRPINLALGRAFIVASFFMTDDKLITSVWDLLIKFIVP